MSASAWSTPGAASASRSASTRRSRHGDRSRWAHREGAAPGDHVDRRPRRPRRDRRRVLIACSSSSVRYFARTASAARSWSTSAPMIRQIVSPSGRSLRPTPAAAGPLTRRSRRVTVRTRQAAHRVRGRLRPQPRRGLRGVLLCVDSATIPVPTIPTSSTTTTCRSRHRRRGRGEARRAAARRPRARARPAGRAAHRRPHRLVPFVREIVPEVDVPGGRIVITPPGRPLRLAVG